VPAECAITDRPLTIADLPDLLPGFRPVNTPRVAIHHFKWRGGVLAYLRRRLDMLTAGEWRELSSAPRLEATRFFDHINAHGGRFDVTDPGLSFRRVDVRRLPGWWAAESQHLVDTWRPPTPMTTEQSVTSR
jgi:hypothetical protein